MALWIDDMLTQQREWYAMSGDACALLIELWSAAKNAGNDGAFEVHRLHKVSEHFTLSARDELVEFGWLHEEGQGCPKGSELCLPVGVDGYVFLHNVAGRQESSVMSSERRKEKLLEKRKAGYAAAHKQWHVDRARPKKDCELCQEEGLVA